MGIPAAYGVIETLHATPIAAEAGLGVIAGVAAAAMIEAGYKAEPGPNRYTVGSMVALSAAGAATGPLIHSLASAADPAAIAITGAIAGPIIGFAAACAHHNHEGGKGDTADQGRLHSKFVAVPLVLAGAGGVASALLAVTGLHPIDTGLIHALALGGAGAVGAPLLLARLHRAPAPQRQLAE